VPRSHARRRPPGTRAPHGRSPPLPVPNCCGAAAGWSAGGQTDRHGRRLSSAGPGPRKVPARRRRGGRAGRTAHAVRAPVAVAAMSVGAGPSTAGLTRTKTSLTRTKTKTSLTRTRTSSARTKTSLTRTKMETSPMGEGWTGPRPRLLAKRARLRAQGAGATRATATAGRLSGGEGLPGRGTHQGVRAQLYGRPLWGLPPPLHSLWLPSSTSTLTLLMGARAHEQHPDLNAVQALWGRGKGHSRGTDRPASGFPSSWPHWRLTHGEPLR
jgi:hypothetical protein